MPGTEELMARLKQLEDGYYGDKEAARQEKFFNQYGSRFGNNHGLGVAILNELDARGVDTSAADEAVQQIIDELRTECGMILESLKETQREAIETTKKVEDIANAVGEAVAANPDAEPSLASEIMEPSENIGVPDAGGAEDFMPLPPESEQMPEQTPEQMPEPAQEPMPEQMPEPAQEPVVSDSRLKKIKNILSDRRAKNIKADAFKPSNSMLEIASRGF